MDVHAAKVVAAILDFETGELRFQKLGGESAPVVDLCRALPGPVRAAYEAGPLVRAREDLRMDLMRARHRLSKFLLRHEIRFEGPGNNWTQRHLAWLAKLEFSDRHAGLRARDPRHSYEQSAEGRSRSILDSGPHDETRSCGHPDPRISA